MTLDSLARLCRGIGATPVAPLHVRYRGVSRRVLLKCEWHNPTGSIKDRTAAGLVWAIDRERRLTPGTVVVESTSGNLGMALARLLPTIGCTLLAVIDPKTPSSTVETLRRSGAQLRTVTEPDGRGGYLLTRLDVVADLCARDPGLRRTDQYTNTANPMIHRMTTGPEIAAQGGPELAAVYVAVSTGGTLGGIAAHLRHARPEVRVVAVDVRPSMALDDGPAADRLIPGIGASRRSTFLTPASYTHVRRVVEAEAVAVARVLAEDTGLRIGGSAGCALQACIADDADPGGTAVCVCPDSGDAYADTLYEDGWLMAKGIHEAVKRAVDDYRSDGLVFTARAAAA